MRLYTKAFEMACELCDFVNERENRIKVQDITYLAPYYVLFYWSEE